MLMINERCLLGRFMDDGTPVPSRERWNLPGAMCNIGRPPNDKVRGLAIAQRERQTGAIFAAFLGSTALPKAKGLLERGHGLVEQQALEPHARRTARHGSIWRLLPQDVVFLSHVAVP